MDNKTDTDIPEQVHGTTGFWSRFWKLFLFGKSDKILLHQLPHFVFFGLVGSLLMDFDHVLVERFDMVRPFHLPIWFGSIIFVSCYLSYIHRRVHNSSLNSEVKTND